MYRSGAYSSLYTFFKCLCKQRFFVKQFLEIKDVYIELLQWMWDWEREREGPEEKGFGRRYREWAMAEERYKFAHLDLINQNPSHVPRVQEYYIVNLTLYIFYYFDLAPLYLKFRFSSTIDSIVYTGWKVISMRLDTTYFAENWK